MARTKQSLIAKGALRSDKKDYLFCLTHGKKYIKKEGCKFCSLDDESLIIKYKIDKLPEPKYINEKIISAAPEENYSNELPRANYTNELLGKKIDYQIIDGVVSLPKVIRRNINFTPKKEIKVKKVKQTEKELKVKEANQTEIKVKEANQTEIKVKEANQTENSLISLFKNIDEYSLEYNYDKEYISEKEEIDIDIKFKKFISKTCVIDKYYRVRLSELHSKFNEYFEYDDNINKSKICLKNLISRIFSDNKNIYFKRYDNGLEILGIGMKGKEINGEFKHMNEKYFIVKKICHDDCVEMLNSLKFEEEKLNIIIDKNFKIDINNVIKHAFLLNKYLILFRNSWNRIDKNAVNLSVDEKESIKELYNFPIIMIIKKLHYVEFCYDIVK